MGTTTLSITTFRIMTFSITTLNIKGLLETPNTKDTQHNNATILANAGVLNVIMLNVIMLNVIMLNAITQISNPQNFRNFSTYIELNFNNNPNILNEISHRFLLTIKLFSG